MPSLADYVIIRDSKFELWKHQEQVFQFDLDGNIVSSGGSKRPIIAFFADPSSNAALLTCEIEINDQVVKTYRYSGGVGREHCEVLSHENLIPGETNRIRFRVVAGDGSVGFSDVILWFQRTV
jgi:hypothetical protein